MEVAEPGTLADRRLARIKITEFPDPCTSPGLSGAALVEERVRMHIRGRFRAAVEAVGVADPVGPVDIYPAPLVGILILVDMLIDRKSVV